MIGLPSASKALIWLLRIVALSKDLILHENGVSSLYRLRSILLANQPLSNCLISVLMTLLKSAGRERAKSLSNLFNMAFFCLFKETRLFGMSFPCLCKRKHTSSKTVDCCYKVDASKLIGGAIAM